MQQYSYSTISSGHGVTVRVSSEFTGGDSLTVAGSQDLSLFYARYTQYRHDDTVSSSTSNKVGYPVFGRQGAIYASFPAYLFHDDVSITHQRPALNQ